MSRYSVNLVLVLVSVAASAAACGREDGRTPSERYVIEILGSRTALERYELHASGLANQRTYFRNNHFVREFSDSYVLRDSAAIQVESLLEGSAIGVTELSPFLCTGDIERYLAWKGAEWDLVERHQLLLLEDGTLKKDTDIDRSLDYRCDALSPDGRDGEGVATSSSTIGACSEPDRLGTSIELTFSDGTSVAASVCRADYNADYGGVAGVSFGFPANAVGQEYHVSAQRCMDPLAVQYPLLLQVGVNFPVSSCPREVAVLVRWVRDGSGPSTWLASDGTWTISSLDFVDGGHVTGEIDLGFPIDLDRTAYLRGHFDVPVLRSPGGL